MSLVAAQPRRIQPTLEQSQDTEMHYYRCTHPRKGPRTPSPPRKGPRTPPLPRKGPRTPPPPPLPPTPPPPPPLPLSSPPPSPPPPHQQARDGPPSSSGFCDVPGPGKDPRSEDNVVNYQVWHNVPWHYWDKRLQLNDQWAYYDYDRRLYRRCYRPDRKRKLSRGEPYWGRPGPEWIYHPNEAPKAPWSASRQQHAFRGFVDQRDRVAREYFQGPDRSRGWSDKAFHESRIPPEVGWRDAKRRIFGDPRNYPDQKVERCPTGWNDRSSTESGATGGWKNGARPSRMAKDCDYSVQDMEVTSSDDEGNSRIIVHKSSEEDDDETVDKEARQPVVKSSRGKGDRRNPGEDDVRRDEGVVITVNEPVVLEVQPDQRECEWQNKINDQRSCCANDSECDTFDERVYNSRTQKPASMEGEGDSAPDMESLTRRASPRSAEDCQQFATIANKGTELTDERITGSLGCTKSAANDEMGPNNEYQTEAPIGSLNNNVQKSAKKARCPKRNSDGERGSEDRKIEGLHLADTAAEAGSCINAAERVPPAETSMSDEYRKMQSTSPQSVAAGEEAALTLSPISAKLVVKEEVESSTALHYPSPKLVEPEIFNRVKRNNASEDQIPCKPLAYQDKETALASKGESKSEENLKYLKREMKMGNDIHARGKIDTAARQDFREDDASSLEEGEIWEDSLYATAVVQKSPEECPPESDDSSFTAKENLAETSTRPSKPLDSLSIAISECGIDCNDIDENKKWWDSDSVFVDDQTCSTNADAESGCGEQGRRASTTCQKADETNLTEASALVPRPNVSGQEPMENASQTQDGTSECQMLNGVYFTTWCSSDERKEECAQPSNMVLEIAGMEEISNIEDSETESPSGFQRVFSSIANEESQVEAKSANGNSREEQDKNNNGPVKRQEDLLPEAVKDNSRVAEDQEVEFHVEECELEPTSATILHEFLKFVDTETIVQGEINCEEASSKDFPVDAALTSDVEEEPAKNTEYRAAISNSPLGARNAITTCSVNSSLKRDYGTHEFQNKDSSGEADIEHNAKKAKRERTKQYLLRSRARQPKKANYGLRSQQQHIVSEEAEEDSMAIDCHDETVAQISIVDFDNPVPLEYRKRRKDWTRKQEENRSALDATCGPTVEETNITEAVHASNCATSGQYKIPEALQITIIQTTEEYKTLETTWTSKGPRMPEAARNMNSTKTSMPKSPEGTKMTSSTSGTLTAQPNIPEEKQMTAEAVQVSISASSATKAPPRNPEAARVTTGATPPLEKIISQKMQMTNCAPALQPKIQDAERKAIGSAVISTGRDGNTDTKQVINPIVFATTLVEIPAQKPPNNQEMSAGASADSMGATVHEEAKSVGTQFVPKTTFLDRDQGPLGSERTYYDARFPRPSLQEANPESDEEICFLKECPPSSARTGNINRPTHMQPPKYLVVQCPNMTRSVPPPQRIQPYYIIAPPCNGQKSGPSHPHLVVRPPGNPYSYPGLTQSRPLVKAHIPTAPPPLMPITALPNRLSANIIRSNFAVPSTPVVRNASSVPQPQQVVQRPAYVTTCQYSPMSTACYVPQSGGGAYVQTVNHYNQTTMVPSRLMKNPLYSPSCPSRPSGDGGRGTGDIPRLAVVIPTLPNRTTQPPSVEMQLRFQERILATDTIKCIEKTCSAPMEAYAGLAAAEDPRPTHSQPRQALESRVIRERPQPDLSSDNARVINTGGIIMGQPLDLTAKAKNPDILRQLLRSNTTIPQPATNRISPNSSHCVESQQNCHQPNVQRPPHSSTEEMQSNPTPPPTNLAPPCEYAKYFDLSHSPGIVSCDWGPYTPQTPIARKSIRANSSSNNGDHRDDVCSKRPQSIHDLGTDESKSSRLRELLRERDVIERQQVESVVRQVRPQNGAEMRARSNSLVQTGSGCRPSAIDLRRASEPKQLMSPTKILYESKNTNNQFGFQNKSLAVPEPQWRLSRINDTNYHSAENSILNNGFFIMPSATDVSRSNCRAGGTGAVVHPMPIRLTNPGAAVTRGIAMASPPGSAAGVPQNATGSRAAYSPARYHHEQQMATHAQFTCPAESVEQVGGYGRMRPVSTFARIENDASTIRDIAGEPKEAPLSPFCPELLLRHPQQPPVPAKTAPIGIITGIPLHRESLTREGEPQRASYSGSILSLPANPVPRRIVNIPAGQPQYSPTQTMQISPDYLKYCNDVRLLTYPTDWRNRAVCITKEAIPTIAPQVQINSNSGKTCLPECASVRAQIWHPFHSPS